MTTVSPEYLADQKAAGWPDVHPEDYCHACGRPNPAWFADSAQWNLATRSDPRGHYAILCPSCFVAAWEREAGGTVAWRMSIDSDSRDAHLAAPVGPCRNACCQ